MQRIGIGFIAMASFLGRYAKTTEHLPKVSPAIVVATNYEAVTDEKQQLRYVIGEDAQFYSDEAYTQLIRDHFIN